MLMGMFRRKATTESEGQICPFCEFVNTTGTTTCVQCYYEMNKAPRDQGEDISSDLSNSIFDELMSEEDDSYEESEALDVVLALDADPLEINQYEVTNFDSEEPEQVGFIESSSPELNETVSHEPVEVSAEEIGEPIKDYEKIDFSNIDPLSEVPEPVHRGKGAVFSPDSPEMDGDLKGHIGGNELPSLPSDDLYENKIDFTAAQRAPAPTPSSVALPEIPDLDFDIPVSQPQPREDEVEIEDIPQPEIELDELPISEQDSESPTSDEEEVVDSANEVESAEEAITEEENIPVPAFNTNGRFWPWPEAEPWDPRQIHREVVSALELTKSGKNDEAAKVIDELGPHLSDENVDLIYHIGMVLTHLDRKNDVKTMLDIAKNSIPDNEHVQSALAHLEVS